MQRDAREVPRDGEPVDPVGVDRVGIVEKVDRAVFEALIDREHHQRSVRRAVFVHQAVQAGALSDGEIHGVERRARERSARRLLSYASGFAAGLPKVTQPRARESGRTPKGPLVISRVGFIGLGAMGEPMAALVRRAGFEVAASVHRRRDAARAPARRRDRRSEPDRASLAAASDAVVVCVPDAPQVEEALFGRERRGRGRAKPGLLVVDMSTISPVARVASPRA